MNNFSTEDIDSAPCGFFIFDNSGNFVSVNQSLLDLLEYSWEELKEINIERSLTIASRIFYHTHFFPLLKLHGKVNEIFLTLKSKSSNNIPVLCNAIKKKSGNVDQFHCITMVVIERGKYEQELLDAKSKISELEERAKLAIEISNIGTIDINLTTNKIITSKIFNDIIEVENIKSWDEINPLLKDEYLSIKNNAFQEALSQGRSSFQLKINEDKKYKWIRCNLKTFYGVNENPERIIGTLIDITETLDLQLKKDDFISLASHELKTPLTSLKAYAQLIQIVIKQNKPGKSLELLNNLERQLDKMTKLVHSFLDISKLEGRKMKLIKESFNINELIIETVESFNIQDNKGRIELNLQKVPDVYGDKSKIGNVIDNFINNALKYSQNDKPVIIKTYLSKAILKFEVQDFGKGINNSSKASIFQRFYRADNVQNNQTSGFGLGLYFSAEIIKLHNGNIWFESNEGQGSTFYFSLPIV